MTLKLLLLLSSISTLCRSLPIQYDPFHPPLALHHYNNPYNYEPYDPNEDALPNVKGPAHYDFKYSVNDHHTGDSKTQEETRRGNLVQGSYSVIEPDGTKRIVDYIADPKHGFNAVVRRVAPPHTKEPAYTYSGNQEEEQDQEEEYIPKYTITSVRPNYAPRGNLHQPLFGVAFPKA